MPNILQFGSLLLILNLTYHIDTRQQTTFLPTKYYWPLGVC